MPPVDIASHEVKVFFRRLLVPAELIPSDLKSASEKAGLGDDKKKKELRAVPQRKLTDPVTFDRSRPREVFSGYQPARFREDVVKKASDQMQRFVDTLNAKKRALAKAFKDRDAAHEARVRIARDTTGKTLIDTLDRNVLVNDRDYIERTLPDVDEAIASNVPPGHSPRLRDNDFLIRLRSLAMSVRSSLEPHGLSTLERNTFDLLVANIEAVVGKTEAQLSLSQERGAREAMIGAIDDLLSLRSVPSGTQSRLDAIDSLLAKISRTVEVLGDEIKVLELDVNNLAPFYEPIILDSLIGPASFSASVNRYGQPGTASVKFVLPLESQGNVPDLFLGIPNDKVFDLDILEKAPGLSGTVSTAPGSNGSASFIPARTLNILKPNMRETTVQPFDMIQIWARRRYAGGRRFPNDYYPVFTGFVTRTSVDYSASSVTVDVAAEDVGKIMRLARVNIDPAVLPGARPPGINVTPYSNVLNSPTFSTGSAIIKALVRGAPGTFLGLSQAEVTTRVVETSRGGQAVLGAEVPSADLKTTVVKLATEFEGLLLNLFEDLANNWKPYVNQFKSAFRLWETDYKIKWDIAREVAAITEFEFYADNLGVINYHPPLYMLNPFDVQYLIRDVDIDSESHVKDEAKIVTVADVSSEPSYMGLADIDFVRRSSSLVPAPQDLIQRYGVRWAKKNIPIFSGIDNLRPREAGSGNAFDPTDLDRARTTYARSWLNRRNMEAMSATVTLNGVPEIRVCNTVAFVGDPTSRLTGMVKGTAGNLFQTLGVQSSLAQKFGSLPGLNIKQDAQRSLGARQQSMKAIEGMKDVLVYYVSEVHHTYVQGSSFKTRLGLTHGRHWTEPLPYGSVGFGLDKTDTDDSTAVARRLFGQDGANSAEFASSLAAMLQFLSTGDPTFIKRAKANQDRQQFGMVAGTPSPLSSAEPTLTAGALDPVRPRCRVLTGFPDLKAGRGAVRQSYASLTESMKGFLNINLPKVPTLNLNLTASAAQAVAQATAQVKQNLNVDPGFAALSALLRENPTLTELARFASGDLLPSSLVAALPADQVAPLLGHVEPVIVYGFVAKSDDGTVDKALKLAEGGARKAAAVAFSADLVAQGQTGGLTDSQTRTLAVTAASTQRNKKSEGGKTVEEILVQGTVVVGRQTACR